MELGIYTKVCLSCVMGDEWGKIQTSIIKHGYNIKVYRTTYDSSLHKKATELWGNDDYLAFAVFPDGKCVAVGAIENMFEEIKDKRVKAGKAKPVRKKRSRKSELRGLSNTKRRIRVDSVEDKVDEIKVEVEA